jgi:hypothetical protein
MRLNRSSCFREIRYGSSSNVVQQLWESACSLAFGLTEVTNSLDRQTVWSVSSVLHQTVTLLSIFWSCQWPSRCLTQFIVAATRVNRRCVSEAGRIQAIGVTRKSPPPPMTAFWVWTAWGVVGWHRRFGGYVTVLAVSLWIYTVSVFYLAIPPHLWAMLMQ